MMKHFKKKSWAKIILALFVFRFCCPALATQELTLGWNPSTGPDVAGVFIYYGETSGVYPNKVDAGLNNQMTVTNLQEGKTYYFVAMTYDASGDESLPSNEIQYIVPGSIQLTAVNSQSVNLQFPVAPGHWYEIQVSSDLKSWATIGATAIASSNIWTQFMDSQASRFASRFYRLVMH